MGVELLLPLNLCLDNLGVADGHQSLAIKKLLWYLIFREVKRHSFLQLGKSAPLCVLRVTLFILDLAHLYVFLSHKFSDLLTHLLPDLLLLVFLSHIVTNLVSEIMLYLLLLLLQKVFPEGRMQLRLYLIKDLRLNRAAHIRHPFVDDAGPI